MICKVGDVLKKRVFSINVGRRLGEVTDVVYDPSQNRMCALVVGGGLFEGKRFLLVEDVRSIGPDAILVESEEYLKDAEQVEETISSIAQGENSLVENKVLSESGTILGKITDIYFDTATGNVSHFEVSDGVLLDFQEGRKMVQVADVVTIGDDVTIVRSSVEHDFEAQEGGLRGKARKKYQQITSQQVKGKARDVGSKLLENFDDARVAARSKFEELKARVEQRNKRQVVGRYLTKSILGEDDKVLAKRGEIVTNKLVRLAAEQGILDQVLKHSSKEPMNGVGRSLGG